MLRQPRGKLIEYEHKAMRGRDMSLSIQEEQRVLDDLRRRQSTRLGETESAAVLSLSAPEILGVAAVVPAEKPAVSDVGPGKTDMRRSDEVEDAAMAHAIRYERARGWYPDDVSAQSRGYDVYSTGPDSEVRYIEVKGRARTGAVELSENKWLKAEQLGGDYWLYIVIHALDAPALQVVQDPARRLPREEVVPRVRYRVSQEGWGRVAETPTDYDMNR